MRIGILKLGANITWSKNTKSATNYDVISVIEVLKDHHEISVITAKTRNTILPKHISLIDITTDNINGHGFDILMVFNGNVNFWGGQPNDGILNYIHINEFIGRVYYMQTDGALYLKQLWGAIENREWNTWSRDEIFIDRQDIRYITQGRDYTKLDQAIRQDKNAVFTEVSNMHHFRLEQAFLYNPPRIKRKEKKYDLIYGGAPRNASRKKSIKKFYGLNDDNISLHIFGALNSNNSGLVAKDNLSYGGRVANNIFPSKLSEGISTCIISDEYYWDNMFTLRMYESMSAHCVMFIDLRTDADKLFYSPDFRYKDFTYVTSARDLVQKIQQLKAAPAMAQRIVDSQIKDTISNFDKTEYRRKLNWIIEQ